MGKHNGSVIPPPTEELHASNDQTLNTVPPLGLNSLESRYDKGDIPPK